MSARVDQAAHGGGSSRRGDVPAVVWVGWTTWPEPGPVTTKLTGVFGFILDDPAVQQVVQRYLAENLPTLDAQALRTSRGTVGVIALLGLPVTGWFWADAMRSSIRKIWGLPEYPGALVVRLLIDLLVLTGLGILLVASLATAFATVVVANRMVDSAEATAPTAGGS